MFTSILYPKVTVNLTFNVGEDVNSIKVYHRLRQPNSIKGNDSYNYDQVWYDYNIVDVNECATDNGGCSQRCINRIGGFSCECYAGYHLSQLDNSSCIAPGVLCLI